ncbi:nucleotidyltransferase family protein [Intestinibacillus massiliensis]|nr:nucleotidyltransferase family protein [Intestinibacillus massiliensis]
MKICGVIAEYNPFHNGHALQLAETRRILGGDTAIVCVMSGNFVQRGDLGIVEKYSRAEAAARCGADLVLELPLGAALSSADGFAVGGVRALDALGGVGYLSFGSECGSASLLLAAARALERPGAQNALRAGLRQGLSYAAACQSALQPDTPGLAELLAAPNNTLGIAYCRAIARTGSLLTPFTIHRRGAGHDSSSPRAGLASASYLRRLLADGPPAACLGLVPDTSYRILAGAFAAGAAPVLLSRLDGALLSYLRRLTPSEFARYERPDEGLCNRLSQAAYEGATFAEACARAQTRRYPLARVRRAYLRAFLGLPLDALDAPPTYLRVLAIGGRGRALLRRFRETAAVPLVVKPLHEKQLPEGMQPALLRDLRADDLYALAFPDEKLRVGGSHFRKTPYCAPEA